MIGRVRCSSDGFWPEILAGDVVVWSPRGPVYDAWTARAMLAEAVALAGLCFWPPSYLNDRGRELGVSPWAEPPLPRCPKCRNEINPSTCWCGAEIPHGGHEGHDAVPMGCDCGRAEVPW